MSTLDLDWNDLPVKPVFLPFVHTVMKYLADFSEAPASLTVGQVIPAAAYGAGAGAAPPGRGATIAVAPSGARVTVETEDGALELGEQGFYDVRTQGGERRLGDDAGEQRRSERIRPDAARSARTGGAVAGPRAGRAWPASATRVPVTTRRRRRSGSGGICWWRPGCCSRAETLLSNRLSQ